MIKRKVFIKTPDNGWIEGETSASTFGELKKQFSSEINWDNKRVVLEQTLNTLEVDEAILPSNDISVYLYTQKTDSGMDYNTMTSRDLRKMCSSREDVKGTSGNYGNKAEMVRKLKKSDRKNKTVVKSESKKNTLKDDLLNKIEEMRRMVQTASFGEIKIIDSFKENLEKKYKEVEKLFKGK